MTDVLIIARSARALAASAHRAGYNVHAMDCFADEDTRSIAKSVYQLQYSCDGFVVEELRQQIEDVLSRHPDVVLVVGSGFEKDPALLEKLSEFVPVLSNRKSTVVSLKDPVSLCDILDSESIKHPEISLTRPDDTSQWLVKKVAGIGGAHVQWLTQDCTDIAADCYYQKYISGLVSSVVFLANGSDAKIVGLNQQLQSAQFTDMPFLFQGAVSVNDSDEQHKQQIEDVINKITNRAGLVGLCGLDYVLNDAGEIYVLEINPRPPSTFELHEQEGALFAEHLPILMDGRLITSAITTINIEAMQSIMRHKKFE